MNAELSWSQLRALRRQLDDRFDELRARVRDELIAADAEHYADIAGRVHDPGEESVADLLYDVELAAIHQHVEEIRGIERALMLMARGIYGLCGECDAPIGFERLRAYPTAERCHDCQALHEKRATQAAP
jgi:RNA polymerase-binding transcription factor DksA